MVRDLIENDIIELTDIYNYYIENTNTTFEEVKLSYDAFKRRCEDIMKIYPFLVYEEQGEVLGFAYLDKFSIRPSYRFTASLSIYVKKTELRKGIGEILYKRLEAKAINMGIRNIVAIISSDNNESLNFHSKMEFRVDGVFRNFGYKFGEWLGVYYMTKSINDYDIDPKIYKYNG